MAWCKDLKIDDEPQNWFGISIPPEKLLKIALDDGIPVTWVPPAAILIELVFKPTREARLALLIAKQDVVLENCNAVAMECTDSELADDQYLLLRALTALQSGHHEAAMALAVSMGEPLAVWASTPRVIGFTSDGASKDWEKKHNDMSKYLRAAQEIAILPSGMLKRSTSRKAFIAPIVSFFKPFNAANGKPVPTSLSRHAVAHCPKKEHFTPENALLAVMLVTSILREMQDWCEQVRTTDGL